MKKLTITTMEAEAFTPEELEELAALTTEEDVTKGQSLPRIKINYDSESKICKPGDWIVNQQKNPDGDIENEGQKVAYFIPIAVRNSYSYFSQVNAKLNCNSPMFEDFSGPVRGSRLKNICGKDCKMRQREGSDKCKAQKVVFGVAITKDGEFVDCVGYFGGVSFMPVTNYINEASNITINGKKLPMYSRLVELSSEKHKKGTITYFEPILVAGGFLAVKDAMSLDAKRKDILKKIEELNATTVKEEKDKPEEKTVDPDTIEAEIVEDSEPAFDPDEPITADIDPDSEGEEDLGEAINNIMGKIAS